jgi:hypothetical protein
MNKTNRNASALLDHALEACASKRGYADPDAVAAYLMVANVPQATRSAAIKLAQRWATTPRDDA